MQKKISLRLLPAEAADEAILQKKVVAATGNKPREVSGYQVLKRSIDARGKQVLINVTVNAFINESAQPRNHNFTFKDVNNSDKEVVIIGAGPAGLFAALKLLEAGIRPIILERGKDVKARRRDLAALNKEGVINPDSNYCFGEGGAGTYSDGKLYTRSNKRGDIERILNLFVHFGATENILYDAHPHIGTNKLPQIITAMRELIIACGGKVWFNKKVTSFNVINNKLDSVTTADGDVFRSSAFILATGHSARDIFESLQRSEILIEAKPFALGVRVEHPQSLIDSIQYHQPFTSDFNRDEHLPPASYSLVEQIQGKGVFSFCMCPGGIIAPASTNNGELVVNGWSPSKRNNPYANSGIVVQVTQEEALKVTKHLKVADDDPLLYMHFQKLIEEKAFTAGGGGFVAPAQRMVDFSKREVSTSLPGNSYLPGLNSAALEEVLPSFIHNVLAKGFIAFGKKMRGYYTNEAVVVATESRTSCPIRVPRNPETYMHPHITNLFPCGEGAGYAGGIVSAAMDGENVAVKITEKLLSSR